MKCKSLNFTTAPQLEFTIDIFAILIMCHHISGHGLDKVCDMSEQNNGKYSLSE